MPALVALSERTRELKSGPFGPRRAVGSLLQPARSTVRRACCLLDRAAWLLAAFHMAERLSFGTQGDRRARISLRQAWRGGGAPSSRPTCRSVARPQISLTPTGPPGSPPGDTAGGSEAPLGQPSPQPSILSRLLRLRAASLSCAAGTTPAAASPARTHAATHAATHTQRPPSLPAARGGLPPDFFHLISLLSLCPQVPPPRLLEPSGVEADGGRRTTRATIKPGRAGQAPGGARVGHGGAPTPLLLPRPTSDAPHGSWGSHDPQDHPVRV